MCAKRIHIIDLPKKIVVGRSVRYNISQYIKEILPNISSCLVITGPHVYKIATKEILEFLEESGINVSNMIVEDSSIKTVEKVLNEVRDLNVDSIISVGGGKVIDVGKFVAFKKNIPFISMPTAASHDGIASPFASIKGLERPTSVRTREPVMIIADTEIITKAPRRLLISGSGDAIAKLTAVLDWRLAYKLKNEYYGEYAASLALLSAKHIINFSDVIRRYDEEAVRVVIEALISSSIAMCIAGSTRPCSGSEHLFSHALDVVAPKPALHGEQCGVGTIMMSYLHGRNWRKVKNTLRKIGAPTTAKELGISDYHVIKALTIAHKIRPERYTILGESGLTWEAAENLARITGVID